MCFLLVSLKTVKNQTRNEQNRALVSEKCVKLSDCLINQTEEKSGKLKSKMPFHSNRADAGTANGSSSGNYSGDDRDLRSGTGQYDRYDSDLMDKPIYLLEHLATFTVNQESGILYPADGMRRLLQLEKSTGIWSQKMKLCLDRQWVLIMDYETGVSLNIFVVRRIEST